jgi:hypothetical protein
VNAEFPYVNVDPKFYPIVGEPDADSRIYRREGAREEISEWFHMVMKICGHAVSPGGVVGFANVSRAGVYKAINEGRLTAFGFHITKMSRSVFGFKRKMRESAYVYVPVSEAEAWGKIIEAKAKAKTLTRDDNPGWVDDRTYYKLERGTLEGKYPRKRKARQP